MPIRGGRRGNGNGRSEPKPPTSREWADAPLELLKHAGPSEAATTFELKKAITRGGKTWTQTLWLNVHQVRGVARDHGQ